MKPIFLRAVFFFFLVVLETSLSSVSDMLFLTMPIVVLSAIVSLALLRGFGRTWQWAVVVGIFVDALTFGRIGMTSGIFVLAAAMFGFVSQRWISAVGGVKYFLFGGLIWIFAMTMPFLVAIPVLGATVSFEGLMTMLSSGGISRIGSGVFSVALFSIVFASMLPFERYVSFFERERSRSISL